MKISSLKSFIFPCMIATTLLLPFKIAQSVRYIDKDAFYKEMEENRRPFEERVLDDIKIINKKNFRGGVVNMLDSASLALVKERMYKDTTKIEYSLPIKNTKNVYLEKCGMYFANRPLGRPHLGLDIFVTPYARKPKIPVLITSPVDGVVVSEKHARKSDNVIANSIGILGKDGRRYVFEHLARSEDYKDYTPIELPKAGTYIHRGDSIGYVGRTGETTLWHLHMCVMTDKQLEKQLSSKKWLNIQRSSPYSSLCGQVDPLSEKEAGPIANLLNTYRK